MSNPTHLLSLRAALDVANARYDDLHSQEDVIDIDARVTHDLRVRAAASALGEAMTNYTLALDVHLKGSHGGVHLHWGD